MVYSIDCIPTPSFPESMAHEHLTSDFMYSHGYHQSPLSRMKIHCRRRTLRLHRQKNHLHWIEARDAIKTVFSNISYMYSHGHVVAHHDLKPENLLLNSTTAIPKSSCGLRFCKEDQTRRQYDHVVRNAAIHCARDYMEKAVQHKSGCVEHGGDHVHDARVYASF